jgi:hypothetical protein
LNQSALVFFKTGKRFSQALFQNSYLKIKQKLQKQSSNEDGKHRCGI